MKKNEKIIWLTKNQLALLFKCDTKTIDYYLKEACKEELQLHNIKTIHNGKEVIINFYSTEAIFSIGYRISNKQGIAFRKWATQKLMK